MTIAKTPLTTSPPHSSHDQLEKRKSRSTATCRTLNDVDKLRIQMQKANCRAQNTLKKYNQYVGQGRRWIAQYIPEGGGKQDLAGIALAAAIPANFGVESADDNIYSDPEFRSAFNDAPNKYSHKALGLFLTCKVFGDTKCGKSTSDGIYSAFRHLWKNVAGDTYRGKWRYNREEERWEGNPIESAEVQDVLEAIKRHCSANAGDRKHSVAMSKEYMDLMFNWSEKICSQATYTTPPVTIEERALRIKHAMALAFFSTAWTLWSRNFETIGLQKKHISGMMTDSGSLGLPYFTIHLENRKGHQNRMDKIKWEQDLRNNTYKIFDQPKFLASCNAFFWLPRWMNYLENEVYQHQLGPEDYIFPNISLSNGIVKCGEHVTTDTIQKLIREFSSEGGVVLGYGQTLSMHCFRRGGAQYRFMFAPVSQRWNLRVVRWWGGWAEGEQSTTLIRYLLDELSAYEADCSGALNPDSSMAGISLVGESNLLAAPALNEELKALQASITHLSTEFQTIRMDISTISAEIARFNPKPEGPVVPLAHTTVLPQSVLPPSTSHMQSLCYSYQQPFIPQLFYPLPPYLLQSNPQLPYPLYPLYPSIQQPYLLHPSNVVQQPYPLHPDVVQQPHVLHPSSQPLLDSEVFSAPAPPHHHAVNLDSNHANHPPEPEPNHPRSEHPLPEVIRTIPDIPLKNLETGRRLSPRSESWREIVQHWLHPDPDRGLHTALKDWPAEWTRGKNKRLVAQKYHNRRIVAVEYLEHYGSDDAQFLNAYPEAKISHTALRKAINKMREIRGELVTRGDKNREEEEDDDQ